MLSVEELLNNKHNYININNNIMNIIDSYNSLKNCFTCIDNLITYEAYIDTSNSYIKCLTNILNQNKAYIDIINNQIYENCNHNFVTDWIDINPDESRQIEYCIICELNKQPNNGN